MANEGDWYDIEEYHTDTGGSWKVDIDGVTIFAPKSQCETNSEDHDSVEPNEIWIPDWLAKKEGLIDE